MGFSSSVLGFHPWNHYGHSGGPGRRVMCRGLGRVLEVILSWLVIVGSVAAAAWLLWMVWK